MYGISAASGASGLSGSSVSGQAFSEANRVTCEVRNEDITDQSVLKPGDSIGVKGGASSGLLEYYHLGIYLGNEEVIDYTNDSEVRRIKLSVFTENNTRQLCRIHYLKAPPANNADAIIENAALYFKNQDFGTYDLITNNCEHFVTFCTFGKRFSFQVAKTVQSSGGSCVSM